MTRPAVEPVPEIEFLEWLNRDNYTVQTRQS